MPSRPPGFSDEAAAFAAQAPARINHGPSPMLARFDFVQAERDRLRRNELDTREIASGSDPRLAGLADMPFPMMADVTSSRLSRFKELWRTRHQSAVSALARGSGLHIDLGSGLYVIGKNRLESSDRFRDVFGPTRTSLGQEVGVPVTLGSGLWALQSEE